MKIIKLTSLPVSAITAVLLSFSRHGGRCYNALAEVFAKQKLLLLLLAWTLITITSCGGAGAGGGGADAPEGTITLNFGGASSNARAVVYPPDNATLAKLSYTVQLKGAATITVGPTKPGESKLSITAPAGNYELTVTATLDGALYAKGTAQAAIQAGKTIAVSIQMTLDGSIIIGTTFTNIDDFRAWLDKQPANTTAKPYDVKLNINGLGTFDITNTGTNAKSLLGNVLETNSGKYVNLDLSGSIFTMIGSNNFYSCSSLTNITIPTSVNFIGENAFRVCENLTSIIIPASVTTIGDGAFYSCKSLINVTFEKAGIDLGDDAFPEVHPTLGTTAGNNLKDTYLDNATGGAGTYIRTGPQEWQKQ
jgi:hypothetical protein